MTVKISVPLRDSSFRSVMICSESREERPLVGSSMNRIEGARMTSSAMLMRFLWPPLMIFFIMEPTLRSLISERPSLFSVSRTRLWIASLFRCPKQSFDA